MHSLYSPLLCSTSSSVPLPFQSHAPRLRSLLLPLLLLRRTSPRWSCHIDPRLAIINPRIPTTIPPDPAKRDVLVDHLLPSSVPHEPLLLPTNDPRSATRAGPKSQRHFSIRRRIFLARCSRLSFWAFTPSPQLFAATNDAENHDRQSAGNTLRPQLLYPVLVLDRSTSGGHDAA